MLIIVQVQLNKKLIFFHVEHFIANTSNPMPHLTRCYYLMLAIKGHLASSKFWCNRIKTLALGF
jgi:hypothetical protein